MIGRVISHYEIVEKLGEGGMGVVYKARDTRLGRFVALKVLPPDRMADPERRQRFVQEARAASALNNPHIVAIHDIDESDGVHFIAMEHVEGRTLADRIGHRGLAVRDALGLGIQIADALAQAHARGIVHRDLKPTNVMVTSEGVAKVLDFGLAKLVETEVSEEAETDLKPATDEGTIVGTAAYMSPEQAQGKRVDARSDIFSFGSVLYEMLTGRRAFAGETKVSTLAAILKEEPRPPGELVPAVPHELGRIIQHCLRKDPARRLQHMDDVRTLLEQLREDSDSGKLAAAPASRRRALSRPALAGIATVALAAIAAFGLWLGRRSPPAPEAPLVATPLTSNPGSEIQPSFSPDGNEVAFAWDGEKQDNFDIYRKLIGPGEPLRLTRDPADDLSPAWSPDGRSIAFLRQPQKGRPGVWLIPALGGTERRVAELGTTPGTWDIFNSGLAWTADSLWLIVSDEPEGEPPGLFLLSPETGEKKRLTSAPKPGYGDWDPALSPDQRALAFVRQVFEGSADIHLLSLGPGLKPGSSPERLTLESRDAASPAWTPDGAELLFSQGNWLSERQTFRLTVGSRGAGVGSRRPVPVGTDATNLALSHRSRRLVFSRKQHDTNVYRLELRGPGSSVGEPERLIASTRLDHCAEYSPNGDAVVFVSTRSGSEEIWVANADGSSPRQLTSMGGPLTSNPRWSPDGKTIVFDSRREGSSDLYLVSPDGGAPRRLTDHPGSEAEARWSRDGRWIYFGSGRTGRGEVWKIAAGGGEPIQVTRNEGRCPSESPDGRWLYYAKGPAPGAELWRAPLSGGEETRILDGLSYGYNYVATDQGIYFVRASQTLELHFFDLSVGRAKPLLLTRGAWGLGLSLSTDGRWLIFSQQDAVGADLILVENFH
jgi:serine/threonine protein kinase